MQFASPEALRADLLARLAERGTRIVADAWGTAPVGHAELVAEAARRTGDEQHSLRAALRRGLNAQRNLWVVTEHNGARRIVLATCVRLHDDWEVLGIVREAGSPAAFDVPGVVWREAQAAERGANTAWRAEVAEYRRRAQATRAAVSRAEIA